jgi:hypothetical protein
METRSLYILLGGYYGSYVFLCARGAWRSQITVTLVVPWSLVIGPRVVSWYKAAAMVQAGP